MNEDLLRNLEGLTFYTVALENDLSNNPQETDRLRDIASKNRTIYHTVIMQPDNTQLLRLFSTELYNKVKETCQFIEKYCKDEMKNEFISLREFKEIASEIWCEYQN